MTASGLLDAIGRLADAANRHDAAGADAETLVRLHRLRSDAAVLRRLELVHLDPLPAHELARAMSDAERVLATLAGSADLELAAVLSDRLMRSVGYVALAGADRPDGAPPHHPRPNETDLGGLAGEYRGDARRELRIMVVLYAAALVLLVATLAIALAGIRAAQGGDDFRFTEFAAFGLVALVSLSGAALAARRAMRHGVVAQESTRLQRQFAGLDAYLSPMPPILRDLMRGTLAQQLFPRLLDDSEPWRETRWPDANALLAAIREAEDEEVTEDQDETEEEEDSAS